MDRLITLEPSNEVAVRLEPGQKCSGEVTLRNVMYTMPVAFRLQSLNRGRYVIKPPSGIIAPLAALTVEITYVPPPGGSLLPEYVPNSGDSFLLHSVVIPGAATTSGDMVPNDWFTTKKKQVFIDSGVRVFFVGSVVLVKLVEDGAMDEVRAVLEKSEPDWHAADSVDAQGRSLLHLAISAGRPDLVQLILEFDPNVEVCSGGQTPLEAAAAAGDALVAELLLARRASTERSQMSSWGPLHHAAAGGHSEVVKLLMMKGAAVNAETSDGRTALHFAAAERRRECARILIAAGARAELRGGADGGTPLHAAAESGDEQMVRLLLSRGTAGLKEVRNLLGRTPYEVAAESGHGRLYDSLKLGDALCSAARKGEARAIGRIIDRGAAVNGRDQYGWTALMRAGFKGKVEVVRSLIDRGAEVDSRDEEGYTPLHCAVEAGQTEVVEVLVKRGGADVEARTGKGKTAMQIAGLLGYTGIARILTQAGAAREGAPPVEGRVVGGGGGEKIAVGKFREVLRETKKVGNKLPSSGGGRTTARRGGLPRPTRPVAC